MYNWDTCNPMMYQCFEIVCVHVPPPAHQSTDCNHSTQRLLLTDLFALVLRRPQSQDQLHRAAGLQLQAVAAAAVGQGR
jgi:hypothetical protein